METNKYSWNKTLKFSWGHIIAFVALIFISYVMYMGDFYQNGGDFEAAAIKVGVIDLLLLISFIGAQNRKGSDEHFDRSIIIERILICFCPIAFIIAMFPYNHFWSVFEQRQQIKTQFNSSIGGVKQLFDEYDDYAEQRITTYSNNLDTILVARAHGNNTFYFSAGFTGKNDHLRKENFVRTLDLQLRSDNTSNLKVAAIKWIDEANHDASVWNAFLVGNVEQISDAIKTWHKTLRDYSEAKMENETIMGNEVFPFDEDGQTIEAATNRIVTLKEIYTETQGIKLNTIWTGIILFLMLIFPYFLQRRNTKAEGLYFLIPGTKAKSYNNVSSKRRKKAKKDDMNDDIALDDIGNSLNNEDVYSGTF